MENIKAKISELAGPISGELGLEVVDIELLGNMRKPTVRVFIDKQGGVSLEECAQVSRALSAIMDVEDLIKTAYNLEVSSPGLDRPLKGLKDFQANIGKLARVVLKERLDNQSFLVGRITSVEGENIRLTDSKQREVDIPFTHILKARLEIEFK